MPIVRIDEVDDARLGDYTRLTDVALRTTFEVEHGLYIAESAKVIGRAVAAGHVPRSILMSDDWLDRMASLIADVQTRFPGVPIYSTDRGTLEQIAGFHVHRGALASMQRPPLPSIDDVIRGAQRVVVLEGVVDHTNVGAIFRSVAALGADAVLISPQCADPFYRRSVRVSMGAALQVPWTRALTWPGDLDVLREHGFTVLALALDERAVPLDAFTPSPGQRIAIVLGAEGDGLTRAAIDAADVIVRIPMAHGIDSLNVAAASAVAMWALRAR